MHVRGERPSECQPVRARLLLSDAPLPVAPLLPREQAGDQVRPLDSRFGLDQATLGVEAQDALHASRVEE
jgi:hypothetical protein